jgi:coenzyme F420-reducing hydrogenase beta subunit
VQGSKYLQSRIDESYRQVKEDLNSGKKVLFSGVACQVEALKRYLNREYDNLFTIDVLCHGVPSPYVWKKYLDWQGKKNNDSAETVNFRKKNRGWKRYEVEIHFKKGAVYHRPFNEDPYMRLFLQNICLRPSCHDCRFKSLERQSDVTLGDCWGIQNYMPSMDDDNGTSVILVHTEQGKALLERLSSKMNYQVAETDRALPSCSDSRKSVKPHSKRDTFFKRLAQSDDIEQLAKLVRPTMRKRIIGMLKKIRRHIKSKKQ